MADGKLTFETALDTKGLSQGLSKMGTLAAGATKAVGIGVAATSAAMAAVTKFSISVGASFEAEMSKVSAISGATGDDFEKLQAKAKELGSSTKFSATESAQAMEYMAMAGWKTEDMLNGIGGLLDLAAASGEDLGTTADIVTDAMTAFGMSASESGHFADILATASSNANTNVALMGETFKYVAPAAGAMKYSAEDMSLAIGLMANSGIKGSQAGTALRSTLTRMAKPTKESANAMEALGLSIKNEDGTMKSFKEVMLDMRSGFSGMAEDEKAATAAMLGGQEAMSGLLAIANASDADFDKLTSAINECDGASAAMAGTMQDNLQGSITTLKSSVEGLGIAIYDQLSGDSSNMVNLGTEYINQLRAGLEENGAEGLAEAIGDVLGDISGRAADFAPQLVDVAISILDSLVNGLVSNSDKLGRSMAAILAQLVKATVTIAPQLVKAAIDLVMSFGRAILTEIPVMIPEIIQGAIGIVTDILSNVNDFQNMGIEIVMSIARGLIDGIPTLIDALPAIIEGLISFIVSSSPRLAMAVIQLIVELDIALVKSIPMLIAHIPEIFISIVQGIKDGIGSLLDLFKELNPVLFDSIVAFFTEKIPEFLDNVMEWLGELPERVRDWGGELLESAREAAKGAVNAVLDFFKKLPDNIAYAIGFVIGRMIKWGADMTLWIVKNVPIIIDNIIKFFEELPGSVAKWLKNVIENVAAWGSDMKSKAGEAGKTFVDNVIDSIKNLPANVWNWLLSTIQKVADFVSNMKEKAGEAAKKFIDALIEGFKSLPEKMGEIANNAIDGLVNGLLGGVKKITNGAKNLANSLFGGLKDGLDIHSPSKKMKWIGQMCVEGFDEPIRDYNPYMSLDKTVKFSDGALRLNGYVNGSGTDYDRLGEAVAAAFERCGFKVNIGKREFGRIVREVMA